MAVILGRRDDDGLPSIDFRVIKTEVTRHDPAPDPWKSLQDFRHERLI